MENILESLMLQRGMLVSGIVEADEGSLGYENKVNALQQAINATDYRIDELLKYRNKDSNRTFIFENKEFKRSSIITAINFARERTVVDNNDTDEWLQRRIDSLSEAEMVEFRRNLRDE